VQTVQKDRTGGTLEKRVKTLDDCIRTNEVTTRETANKRFFARSWFSRWKRNNQFPDIIFGKDRRSVYLLGSKYRRYHVCVDLFGKEKEVSDDVEHVEVS
jgi:hypothetical protein